MALGTNEFAIGLTAEISGVDLSNIQRVTKSVEKEFLKNLNIRINKGNIEEVRKDYADLSKVAADLQLKFNNSLKSGAVGMSSYYQDQLKQVEAALTSYSNKAASKKLDIDTEASAKAQEVLAARKSRAYNILQRSMDDTAKSRQKEVEDSKKQSTATAEQTAKTEENTQAKKRNADANNEASTSNNSFTAGLKNGLGAVTGAALGYRLVTEAINTMKQAMIKAVKTIVELNKEMTDVQMVTGGTADSTYKLFDSYNDMAKQLGVVSKEVIRGSSEWLRQGKTISETNELLVASTMQSKIANIKASQSTTLLTSTLNGYKMEVSNAMHVVDALSAVDLKAATSVEEMAIALQKTANTARNAGVEFETLVGYIAAVSENTRQAPEIIGTSMKTLFSRLENVKAGKSIDEYGDSLNDTEKVLNRFNISMRTSTRQFRESDDILASIHDRWGDLENAERDQIITAAAGVRQREVFISLMDNWDKAMEYSTIAMNSDGKAAEKYAIYLQSLEAEINNLKATFEGFVYNKEFTEFLKNGVALVNDFSSAFVALGKSASSVFSILSPMMPTIFSFISGYKEFKAFATGDKSFFDTKEIDESNTKISDYTIELDKLSSKVDELDQKKLSGVISDNEVVLLEDYKKQAADLNNEISLLQNNVNKTEFTKIFHQKGIVDLDVADPEYAAQLYDTTTKTTIDPSQAISLYEDYSTKSDSVNKSLNEAYAKNAEILKELIVSGAGYATSLQAQGVEITDVQKALIDKADAMGWTIEKTKEAIDSNEEQSYSIITLQRDISNFKTETSSLSDAYAEMSENGKMSIETVSALIQKFPELTNEVEIVNGVMTIQKETLSDVYDKMKTEGLEAIAETMFAHTELGKSIQNSIEAYKNLDIQLGQSDTVSRQYAQNRMIDMYMSKYATGLTNFKDKYLDIFASQRIYEPKASGGSGTSEKDKAEKEYQKQIQKQLDREKKALEKEKDYWSDYYDDKIDEINKIKDALDEQAEQESKLLAIEEAKAKLAKANNETIRIYEKGKGFIYRTDITAVSDAQKDLDNLLKEWDVYQKKLALEKQVKDFKDAKDATIKDLEEEIDKLQDLKDKWSDALDITDESIKYKDNLGNLKDFENASYEERLEMLKSFVDNHNSIVSNMRAPTYGSYDNEYHTSLDVPEGPVTDKDFNHGYDKFWDGEEGKWVTIPHYANGTLGAKKTSVSMVGEQGREMRVVDKDDGIMPHRTTENLMKWGKLTPEYFFKESKKFTQKTDGASDYKFMFDSLVLPGVTDYNSFRQSLVEKAKSIAIQVSSERS